ncbi:Wzz/FepE/Etk N-terminal domain-containing protein [Paenibacillus glycanilyticus]|uniref:YveK family protein n=1 Tax=Paenibacillus glycanilyticus TaxID=126569 RepID=UPI00203B4D82|nr:Wzz/FepE/Etk N-terminal domain-containing protein [Paenibacillus glycanilyticus]MCM3628764.1 Wzz/FepE/Etk N-terminal domain-containing protein [Paenibacillus glycanilyticus]
MELKQYVQIVWKKWWLIAAVVIVAVIATGIKSFFFTTPIYQAKATLIVNQSPQQAGVETLNLGLLQSNVMLINSYKKIVESAFIMDKVVEQNASLGVTSEQLSSKVTVTSSDDSQIMEITYNGSSYKQAAQIVNAVSVVFLTQIPNIMQVDNVTILDKANENDKSNPINNSPILNILISFIVALMMAVGIVFLLDYLDDTIKSETEMLQTLDVPVLAMINKINRHDLGTDSKPSMTMKKDLGETAFASINQ